MFTQRGHALIEAEPERFRQLAADFKPVPLGLGKGAPLDRVLGGHHHSPGLGKLTRLTSVMMMIRKVMLQRRDAQAAQRLVKALGIADTRYRMHAGALLEII